MLYPLTLTNIPSYRPGNPGSNFKFLDRAGTWNLGKAHFFSLPPALSYIASHLVDTHWKSQLTCPTSVQSCPSAILRTFGCTCQQLSLPTGGHSCEAEALARLGGSLGRLFQSFGILKFVPERGRSSAWVCLFGHIDSFCCGEECGWGRAVMRPRAHGSPR